MLSESLPPPIYSQQDPDEQSITPSRTPSEPQIHIIPATGSINFQKGYLGADGERAAIEGELQIKGTEDGVWHKLTMSLRTVETAYDDQIELGLSEIVLFSSSPLSPTTTTLPSTFPFAIPLMPDTPQSMHTPQSSLSHTLTATLHPADPLLPVLSKTMTVHTRRYTSHSHMIAISPETHRTDDPTPVEVEVPRAVFKVGEPIPLYVAVPPPSRELVVDHGLRLRNVMVELVQVVRVKRGVNEGEDQDEGERKKEGPVSLAEGLPPSNSVPTAFLHGGSGGPGSSTGHPDHPAPSSKASISPRFSGPSYTTVIARSGASCGFHSTKTVKLRVILHPTPPSNSHSDFPPDPPAGGYGHLNSDIECPSITQTTLLQSVSFQLNVHVSFLDTPNHTERLSPITIPLVILPPPAPLPEVEEWMDAAYQKKHDRPPVKTFRYDDVDSSAPRYDQRQPGPSAPGTAPAPPPFEERDAPPPFVSESEASTSSRLPTFLESESEIIVLQSEEQHPLMPSPHSVPAIPGEGVRFGFPAADQFDGLSDIMRGSSSPSTPPSLPSSSSPPPPPPPPPPLSTGREPTLTDLVDIHHHQPEIVAALSHALAMDQQEDAEGEQLPPPPPAMDDPSDPPPSIDSEFRSPPDNTLQTPTAAHSGYGQPAEPSSLHVSSPVPSVAQSHGQAPPPYLIPENDRDQGQVTRPPPYVDFEQT